MLDLLRFRPNLPFSFRNMRIIAGTARGRKLSAPPGERTRPLLDRVREALFSILGAHVPEASVLDLYAGTGSIGLEALSRGASACTFVERDRQALHCLQQNIETLGFLAQSRVVRGPVEEQLDRPAEERYDLIFLDPPYDDVRSAGRRERVIEMARRLYEERLKNEGLLVFHVPRDLLELAELERIGTPSRRTWGTTEISLFVRSQHSSDDAAEGNAGDAERARIAEEVRDESR